MEQNDNQTCSKKSCSIDRKGQHRSQQFFVGREGGGGHKRLNTGDVDLHAQVVGEAGHTR